MIKYYIKEIKNAHNSEDVNKIIDVIPIELLKKFKNKIRKKLYIDNIEYFEFILSL
jgi:hypothetical protein